MKHDHAEPTVATEDGLDAELDAENAEFDFSLAPRPGRNGLFERAQGHFHDAPDARLDDQSDHPAVGDREPA